MVTAPRCDLGRGSFAPAVFIACLAFTGSSLPAIGNDGIVLTIGRDAAAGRLTLSWSGGTPPYEVYRSSDPAGVVDPQYLIGKTSGQTLTVDEGPALIDFFVVRESVSVNPASAAWATSGCLTAGTNAQAAVGTDLEDTTGNPLSGVNVTMSTTSGTLGPVQADGNRYWTVLSPPSLPGTDAVITIVADGVTLMTQPTIAIAAPLAGPGGGAGGCPADGNLRVRVVDADGSPLAGAHVMAGFQEALDIYQTNFGAPTDGANTGLTDALGIVEFREFGSNLDGSLTVTAAMELRRYVTLSGFDAADVVLPLPLLEPTQPTGITTGWISPVPAPTGDPIELAVMLPDVSFDVLSGLSVNDLIAEDECYEAGGQLGSIAMPANVYVPSQCALSILFCLQQLPEKMYTSAPLPFGERRLLALRSSAPLAALTSGGLISNDVTLEGIGTVTYEVVSPDPATLDLTITQGLSPNLICQIDNPPVNSDVLCVAAGDWDSAGNSDLPPGAGRLFVTGFRSEDAAVVPPPFDITGVTTVADIGDFSGIDYLGAALAQYDDETKPGIPPGTERGSSIILDRSSVSFDGSGGVLVFDDFFPIRTLSRLGRDFNLSPLPGVEHPVADVTRLTILQKITELYAACAPDDSTRQRHITLWEAYVPGSVTGWMLPTPPPGWPRQGLGGDLAGLVDPAATPEDDVLVWDAQTFHLGQILFFDFSGFRWDHLRLGTTHETTNRADY